MEQPAWNPAAAPLRADVTAGADRATPAAVRRSARLAEIQGLRGVAVLAVLVFHSGLPGVDGGFLGVDVFFAISGFVITALLRREMEAGDFSLVAFYLRRARRLLPALLAMLLATALLFCLLAPASMNPSLLPALLTSVFGVSNFYFAGTLDYFDSGIANPVLHTWSLGVEEQFYLVFPALMLVLLHVHRRRASLPPVLVLAVLLVLGFAAAVWATAAQPSSAFYLPWYRAWEFLGGALLAHLDRERLARLGGAWLSWGGALLLGAALLGYRESYVFPGWGALLPVLGTLMLIAGAGPANAVNRVLASRPMQLAGDASYSIYLAHWPVVCLVGMFLPLAQPPVALMALLLGVLGGLALWRTVERPWRERVAPPATPRRLARVPLAMALGTALLAGVSAAADSWWQRHPLALRYLDGARSDPSLFRTGVCFLTPRVEFESFDREQCLSPAAGRPGLLVVGDSLAANLALALQQRYPEQAVLQATAVDYRPGHAAKWPEFTARLDALVASHLSSAEPPLRRVLLFARWDADDLAPLLQHVDSLRRQGIDVTVLGPSPEFYFSLPLILAYSTLSGIDLVPLLAKQERHEVDRAFAAALAGRAQYVSMLSMLCGAAGGPGVARCQVTEGDEALFFDKLHFTRRGAALFAARLPDLPAAP